MALRRKLLSLVLFRGALPDNAKVVDEERPDHGGED